MAADLNNPSIKRTCTVDLDELPSIFSIAEQHQRKIDLQKARRRGTHLIFYKKKSFAELPSSFCAHGIKQIGRVAEQEENQIMTRMARNATHEATPF